MSFQAVKVTAVNADLIQILFLAACAPSSIVNDDGEEE